MTTTEEVGTKLANAVREAAGELRAEHEAAVRGDQAGQEQALARAAGHLDVAMFLTKVMRGDPNALRIYDNIKSRL